MTGTLFYPRKVLQLFFLCFGNLCRLPPKKKHTLREETYYRVCADIPYEYTTWTFPVRWKSRRSGDHRQDTVMIAAPINSPVKRLELFLPRVDRVLRYSPCRPCLACRFSSIQFPRSIMTRRDYNHDFEATPATTTITPPRPTRQSLYAHTTVAPSIARTKRTTSDTVTDRLRLPLSESASHLVARCCSPPC